MSDVDLKLQRFVTEIENLENGINEAVQQGELDKAILLEEGRSKKIEAFCSSLWIMNRPNESLMIIEKLLIRNSTLKDHFESYRNAIAKTLIEIQGGRAIKTLYQSISETK